jgi:hypothetical protein
MKTVPSWLRLDDGCPRGKAYKPEKPMGQVKVLAHPFDWADPKARKIIERFAANLRLVKP